MYAFARANPYNKMAVTPQANARPSDKIFHFSDQHRLPRDHFARAKQYIAGGNPRAASPMTARLVESVALRTESAFGDSPGAARNFQVFGPLDFLAELSGQLSLPWPVQSSPLGAFRFPGKNRVVYPDNESRRTTR